MGTNAGGSAWLPPSDARRGRLAGGSRRRAPCRAVLPRVPLEPFTTRRADVGQHLVEVFFVLAGMLNGKRRVDMQDRLHNAGLTKVTVRLS
jgi:hypothetical protein